MSIKYCFLRHQESFLPAFFKNKNCVAFYVGAVFGLAEVLMMWRGFISHPKGLGSYQHCSGSSKGIGVRGGRGACAVCTFAILGELISLCGNTIKGTKKKPTSQGPVFRLYPESCVALCLRKEDLCRGRHGRFGPSSSGNWW